MSCGVFETMIHFWVRSLYKHDFVLVTEQLMPHMAAQSTKHAPWLHELHLMRCSSTGCRVRCSAATNGSSSATALRCGTGAPGAPSATLTHSVTYTSATWREKPGLQVASSAWNACSRTCFA